VKWHLKGIDMMNVALSDKLDAFSLSSEILCYTDIWCFLQRYLCYL
jgi:hypothetical protein